MIYPIISATITLVSSKKSKSEKPFLFTKAQIFQLKELLIEQLMTISIKV